ncbi:MAG: hypothetical protein OEN23_16990 [Paracoccaceae bacterium]|nr:hypothetical protein [Paracoccaceae bacterium]
MSSLSDKLGVRNPLTIIAVFAGLAEVSGTGILPLLSAETQSIFVWFLMGFSCLLVALFFWTLHTKHHVLYAPSDYRDETLFASRFERGTTISRVENIEKEIEELSGAAVEASAPATNSENSNSRIADPLAAYLLAEELAVVKLSEKYNVSFDRNVRLKENPDLYFDAVSLKNQSIIIAEVKLVKNTRISENLVRNNFKSVQSIFKRLSREQQSLFQFIFCIVFDDGILDSSTNRNLVAKKNSRILIGKISSSFDFKTSVEFFEMRDLEAELKRAADVLSAAGSMNRRTE